MITAQQIATAEKRSKPEWIDNIRTIGNVLFFDIIGTPYFAKLTPGGRIKKDSIRYDREG